MNECYHFYTGPALDADAGQTESQNKSGSHEQAS